MNECVELIVNWYQNNKRPLPWREECNPYYVWISEVMLQQTRIESVIPYYLRFIHEAPNIETLSLIDEDNLLKLWEGLGYYSRARNLKRAACLIMEKFNGVFPSNYEDILSLPGVGEYTAGAIASICFSLKEVCIDGNVMRVFTRIMNYDWDISDKNNKNIVKSEIKKILPDNPGDFNQGIMELGETICLPNGIPKCQECPLKYYCLAFLNGNSSLIPRKIKSKSKIEEEYTIFLLQYNDKVAIRKREHGLLKNMWEFPNKQGFLTYDQILKEFPYNQLIELGITYTHIFSHKKWFMNSYYIELTNYIDSFVWVSLDEIYSTYALPGAFQPFLKYLEEKIKK